MPDDTTPWTVPVSKDTDDMVRTHLAEHGMTAGDLPRFVEEAVKWRVFDQTLAEARIGFDDMAAGDIEALVDEAVSAVRAARGPSPPKAD